MRNEAPEGTQLQILQTPQYHSSSNFKELKPTFTRLSDRKLLERCVEGQTQSANESLHHVTGSNVPRKGLFEETQ